MTKWRAYELIKGAPQGVRWFIGWFKILVVLCLGCLTWAQTDHVLKEGDRARDFSVTIDDSKHEQLAATIRGIRGAYAGVIESLGGQLSGSATTLPSTGQSTVIAAVDKSLSIISAGS
jgi:hypothetical protein